MCGRFTLRTAADAFVQYFLAGTLDVNFPSFKPRFNIAPTQMVAAVRFTIEEKPEACELRWGLLPSWAKDKKISHSMINARGETIAEKPAFRSAFKKRRCAILADGFYEWKADGKVKRPSYIHARDGAPFCFAGLWESWQSPDETIESTTIVTTSSNEFMRDLHDRMPVVLAPENLRRWLDPATPVEELHQLIRPVDNEFFVRHEVGTEVNSPRADRASFIEPIPQDLFGPEDD